MEIHTTDDLFTAFDVNQVREIILDEIHGAEKKSEELRDLLKEKYRGLLDSSLEAAALLKNSRSLQSRIKSLSSTSNSLFMNSEILNFSGKSLDDDFVNFNYTRLESWIQDGLDTIPRLLDSDRVLEATVSLIVCLCVMNLEKGKFDHFGSALEVFQRQLFVKASTLSVECIRGKTFSSNIVLDPDTNKSVDTLIQCVLACSILSAFRKSQYSNSLTKYMELNLNQVLDTLIFHPAEEWLKLCLADAESLNKQSVKLFDGRLLVTLDIETKLKAVLHSVYCTIRSASTLTREVASLQLSSYGAVSPKVIGSVSAVEVIGFLKVIMDIFALFPADFVSLDSDSLPSSTSDIEKLAVSSSSVFGERERRTLLSLLTRSFDMSSPLRTLGGAFEALHSLPISGINTSGTLRATSQSECVSLLQQFVDSRLISVTAVSAAFKRAASVLPSDRALASFWMLKIASNSTATLLGKCLRPYLPGGSAEVDLPAFVLKQEAKVEKITPSTEGFWSLQHTSTLVTEDSPSVISTSMTPYSNIAATAFHPSLLHLQHADDVTSASKHDGQNLLRAVQASLDAYSRAMQTSSVSEAEVSVDATIDSRGSRASQCLLRSLAAHEVMPHILRIFEGRHRSSTSEGNASTKDMSSQVSPKLEGILLSSALFEATLRQYISQYDEFNVVTAADQFRRNVLSSVAAIHEAFASGPLAVYSQPSYRAAYQHPFAAVEAAPESPLVRKSLFPASLPPSSSSAEHLLSVKSRFRRFAAGLRGDNPDEQARNASVSAALESSVSRAFARSATESRLAHSSLPEVLAESPESLAAAVAVMLAGGGFASTGGQVTLKPTVVHIQNIGTRESSVPTADATDLQRNGEANLVSLALGPAFVQLLTAMVPSLQALLQSFAVDERKWMASSVSSDFAGPYGFAFTASSVAILSRFIVAAPSPFAPFPNAASSVQVSLNASSSSQFDPTSVFVNSPPPSVLAGSASNTSVFQLMHMKVRHAALEIVGCIHILLGRLQETEFFSVLGSTEGVSMSAQQGTEEDVEDLGQARSELLGSAYSLLFLAILSNVFSVAVSPREQSENTLPEVDFLQRILSEAAVAAADGFAQCIGRHAAEAFRFFWRGSTMLRPSTQADLLSEAWAAAPATFPLSMDISLSAENLGASEKSSSETPPPSCHPTSVSAGLAHALARLESHVRMAGLLDVPVQLLGLSASALGSLSLSVELGLQAQSTDLSRVGATSAPNIESFASSTTVPSEASYLRDLLLNLMDAPAVGASIRTLLLSMQAAACSAASQHLTIEIARVTSCLTDLGETSQGSKVLMAPLLQLAVDSVVVATLLPPQALHHQTSSFANELKKSVREDGVPLSIQCAVEQVWSSWARVSLVTSPESSWGSLTHSRATLTAQSLESSWSSLEPHLGSLVGSIGSCGAQAILAHSSLWAYAASALGNPTVSTSDEVGSESGRVALRSVRVSLGSLGSVSIDPLLISPSSPSNHVLPHGGSQLSLRAFQPSVVLQHGSSSLQSIKMANTSGSNALASVTTRRSSEGPVLGLSVGGSLHEALINLQRPYHLPISDLDAPLLAPLPPFSRLPVVSGSTYGQRVRAPAQRVMVPRSGIDIPYAVVVPAYISSLHALPSGAFLRAPEAVAARTSAFTWLLQNEDGIIPALADTRIHPRQETGVEPSHGGGNIVDPREGAFFSPPPTRRSVTQTAEVGSGLKSRQNPRERSVASPFALPAGVATPLGMSSPFIARTIQRHGIKGTISSYEAEAPMTPSFFQGDENSLKTFSPHLLSVLFPSRGRVSAGEQNRQRVDSKEVEISQTFPGQASRIRSQSIDGAAWDAQLASKGDQIDSRGSVETGGVVDTLDSKSVTQAPGDLFGYFASTLSSAFSAASALKNSTSTKSSLSDILFS